MSDDVSRRPARQGRAIRDHILATNLLRYDWCAARTLSGIDGMVLLLNDVLSTGDAAALCQTLANDGRHENAGDAVIKALHDHPLFLLGVQPCRFSAVSFSCRGPAAGCGQINDADRDEAAIRADVAVTVFLSDPQSYEGGELIVDTGYGGEPYREDAGACVVHPAFARRRAAPVTRGQSWVANLVVQSLVRDHEQREILYDISCAERYLEVFAKGETGDLKRLRRCRTMLSRMWIER